MGSKYVWLVGLAVLLALGVLAACGGAVAVVMLAEGLAVVDGHVRLGGGDAAAPHRLERQGVAIHRQGAHDVHHADRVRAGMDQCGHGHVARGPGEAVEPGGAADGVHPHILATAQAAPKPLSMPTTVTPLAHEACMASRAVTPSNPAP